MGFGYDTPVSWYCELAILVDSSLSFEAVRFCEEWESEPASTREGGGQGKAGAPCRCAQVGALELLSVGSTAAQSWSERSLVGADEAKEARARLITRDGEARLWRRDREERHAGQCRSA